MIQYNFIPVTKDEENSRLDRVIRKRYPYLNQAVIEKSLRSKLIVINQQKASSNSRVNLGDHIQIASSLIQEDYDSHQSKKFVTEAQARLITDNIIFRDAELIVINKPAGLAVQGGINIKFSVDDIMPYILAKDETYCEDDKSRHKLVHRLDKETSGILLIALSNHMAQDLSYAFKEHFVEKKYLAILTGRVAVDNGRIESLIDGAEAITNYRVLKKNAHTSLVEFKPITGKKHQLRLHALELGFPILGDRKYDPSLRDVKNVNLHLHAAEIIVPYQGSTLKLKTNPPEYFKLSLQERGIRL